MSECQWPAGWHQLSRRQVPKPVTRPSAQVFHPIYLSLLPMTRHVEMDTETSLHIDSGSCNSQARRGLSPVSSFHFLYVRERETAQDWAGDNVSRQKSIFCSHLLNLSIIFGDSKCLLWWQGARAVKERGQSRQGLDKILIMEGLYVDLSTFYSPVSMGKSEDTARTEFYSRPHRTTTQTLDSCKQVPSLTWFFKPQVRAFKKRYVNIHISIDPSPPWLGFG